MKLKINIILIFLLLLNLFIIFPECKEESEHPWPMFKHDPQHTGRVPYPGIQNPILKWEFKAEEVFFPSSSSPSISKDGTIYVSFNDNYLYALNPDGKLKWKFDAELNVDSSPAIDSNGTIYFGSYDNYLYALNLDGKLKWKFRTRDKIESSSIVIGPNKTIYCKDWEGYLYAIGDSPTQPSLIISLILIIIITIIIFITILILNILKKRIHIKEKTKVYLINIIASIAIIFSLLLMYFAYKGYFSWMDLIICLALIVPMVSIGFLYVFWYMKKKFGSEWYHVLNSIKVPPEVEKSFKVRFFKYLGFLVSILGAAYGILIRFPEVSAFLALTGYLLMYPVIYERKKYYPPEIRKLYERSFKIVLFVWLGFLLGFVLWLITIIFPPRL
ncbi:MAG: PQQ-binding-like beta-propeller repeat protein [Candidatus Methanomethylicaceae archaeon]